MQFLLSDKDGLKDAAVPLQGIKFRRAAAGTGSRRPSASLLSLHDFDKGFCINDLNAVIMLEA